MYIGDYLGRRNIYSPNAPAIVDTGKTPELRLTYAQMNSRANRLANWLKSEAGVQKGDRVAILANNCVEHLDLFCACDKLGAVHTGDLARYDEEWYFYIVDRLKDMFISGGENVYPTEIEGILYKHAVVHQCAVIGLPDPKWGEVGRACIVLKPEQSASEAELLEFVAGHLAKYKVPKSVTFVSELPFRRPGRSFAVNCGRSL